MEEIPVDFFSPLCEKGELVYGMGKRQRFGKASVVNTCWTVIKAQQRVKEMIWILISLVIQQRGRLRTREVNALTELTQREAGKVWRA